MEGMQRVGTVVPGREDWLERGDWLAAGEKLGSRPAQPQSAKIVLHTLLRSALGGQQHVQLRARD